MVVPWLSPIRLAGSADPYVDPYQVALAPRARPDVFPRSAFDVAFSAALDPTTASNPEPDVSPCSAPDPKPDVFHRMRLAENLVVIVAAGLRTKNANGAEWDFLIYAASDVRTSYDFVLRNEKTYFEKNLPMFEKAISALRLATAR